MTRWIILYRAVKKTDRSIIVTGQSFFALQVGKAGGHR